MVATLARFPFCPSALQICCRCCTFVCLPVCLFASHALAASRVVSLSSCLCVFLSLCVFSVSVPLAALKRVWCLVGACTAFSGTPLLHACTKSMQSAAAIRCSLVSVCAVCEGISKVTCGHVQVCLCGRVRARVCVCACVRARVLVCPCPTSKMTPARDPK